MCADRNDLRWVEELEMGFLKDCNDDWVEYEGSDRDLCVSIRDDET